MTIVSIDTGDPKVKDSTSAIVKITFNGEEKKRSAMAYTGSFDSKTENLLAFIGEPDFIVIEQIDATNKFIKRSVFAEQVSLHRFLKSIYKDKVQELVRSGRKEIITDDLLKKIELFSEGGIPTHHHDIREATRNLLYFMAKSPELNKVLSKYVQRFFN